MDDINWQSKMQAVVDMRTRWGAACMLEAAKFMSYRQIGSGGARGEADYVGWDGQ